MSGSTSPALEALLLKGEAEAVARVPEGLRTGLRNALDRGEQRASAAEVLWQGGHAAEGLRLAQEAVGILASAVPWISDAMNARDGGDATTGSGTAPPPAEERSDAPGSEAAGADDGAPDTEDLGHGADVATTLARAGVSRKAAERARRVVAEAPSLVLPDLEADVGPTHADAYRDLVAAQRALIVALRRVTRTPRDVRAARFARVGGLAAAVVVALVATLLWVFRPPSATAEASGHFANDRSFGPDKALDGDPATSWLLSDGTRGWIEVRLHPDRDVTSVRLKNARNAPHHDRATEDYRVELWGGGEKLAEQAGTLEMSREPEWVEVDVAADGVDRIRVVVESWHERSGGLSELAWDER